ncbi:DNA internalization-related competence protein ComEC/Rec2 [Herbaspirillum sp. RTI4]|uniref:DNA internalization-related competence protein ComEC/Rec2 n=1 Tax=Herbaspirillum sp. RTI4 TaxID=3048640 RepID=UPI002B22E302|nr:DNA internalization-related competence protein ComEC/Rec2 [Herbaspirillum sp. RTI4]MEA9983523.1 DNA internalization-related competence protein ComEC/Rec2 [Herbaspirillum sp. RTI4]
MLGILLCGTGLHSLSKKQAEAVHGVPRWLCKAMLCLCIGFSIGFLWAALMAQLRLADELPVAWEGRDVTVIGSVANLPDRFAQGVRFVLAVEEIVVQGGVRPPLPSTLALAWYRTPGGGAVPEVSPGSRWRLTVRLKRPHGNANPYGFDYEAWLLEQGIRATGYVRGAVSAVNTASTLSTISADGNHQLDPFLITPGNLVQRLRGWLRTRILKTLAGRPYAGVIVALVIGDQRAIAQEDWTVFNRTGVGHLISISGLHVTMVAGLFGGLVGALWRRSFFTRRQLPLRLPAQKAAILATVAMAWVYVLLAGFGVPAQRTLYMLLALGAACWSARLVSMPTGLCAALGLVLLLDPWAVLWPGFWLSFFAVAIILYAGSGRLQIAQSREADAEQPVPPSYWRTRLDALRLSVCSAARTQYAVTLGLLPLTVLLFGQYSLLSPVANAVAIPVISLLVAPLALIGSILPAPLIGWVLLPAHAVIDWLAALLHQLSALPFAVWQAPVPPLWIFVAALFGTLLLMAPRGWPLRWLGAFACLPLLLNRPATPAPGSMWITAFDVGQGMALLVETPAHRLLYDTGPYYSPESDGGSRVILPYLQARGITRLDAVVVSHSDNDHSGGALSLLRSVAVERVYSSLPTQSDIVRASPRHQRCEAGQHWQWEGVEFSMLHPTSDSYQQVQLRPNARSCVLKVTLGKQSILLPGDIEAPQEAELLATGVDVRADVLLVPHHGSGTSSTVAFLEAVAPEIALFQLGYLNRFHHPKPAVFDRYGRMGIRRLRSDESGAITLEFGPGLDVAEYRRSHARYWYGR